jgi:hypothetical protein
MERKFDTAITVQMELDVSGLQQGVYYLVVKTREGMFVRSVVKQ